MIVSDNSTPRQFMISSASRAIFKSKADSPKKNAPEGFTFLSSITGGKCNLFLVSKPELEDIVVMKLIPKTNIGSSSDLYYNEIKFNILDHPNIIKQLESKEDFSIETEKGKYSASYILMEYASKGDLAHFIKYHKNLLEDNLIRTFFHQIIDGLEYMHSKGAYHLDIKPHNLLLSEDYQVKIADFDGSYLKTNGGNFKCRGTPNYRAPELIRGNVKDIAAVDIYSAAIVLFEFKTGGVFPFNESEKSSVISGLRSFHENPQNFWKKKCRQLKKSEDFFDDDFKKLFQAMTMIDPDYRVGIQGIKKFNWFNKPTLNKTQVSCLVKGVVPFHTIKSITY